VDHGVEQEVGDAADHRPESRQKKSTFPVGGQGFRQAAATLGDRESLRSG
jgi:hypothetical protein